MSTFDVSQQQPAQPQSSPSPSGSLFRNIIGLSIPLGRLFGIPVRMHVLFPAMCVCLAIYGAGWKNWSWVLFYIVLFGPLLAICVLIHELGHCWAARNVTAGHVDHILLWPLGGLAYVGHGGGPKDDIKVALAGPATHIPQLLFWLIILIILRHHNLSITIYLPLKEHFFSNLASASVRMNIILFVVNLLIPVFPLDGGRIFADALLLAGVPSNRSATIVMVVAFVMGVLFVIYGVYRSVSCVLIGLYVIFENARLMPLVMKGRADLHPLFAQQSGNANPAASAI
eukprot:TRINITY_DN12544_c0_g1_i1.p1 TRINITY_DN12544_c0_g1~~TRINITY_DN12544_c0_g1_i1.p1  ORF type:complete len:285 (-),score=48.84 TRINITY_DN12544_c0_g1_i1:158-1012(-)